jgi:hypothetical protein
LKKVKKRSEGDNHRESATRARSCTIGEKDVVGEVKGIDELGVRVAATVPGARSRGDRRNKVQVDPKRCSLRFAMIGFA